MRIIHFLAENYKRLHAVEITPTGAVVDITGKNGQGKTSILDSIYAALAGSAAIASKPVRSGEKEARVELTLGDGDTVSLVVKRRFMAKKDGDYTTSIVVENADGAVMRSPQTLLDGLLGTLSFDPLAFTRMDKKAQLLQLRQLVPGVDFEAIDAANAVDYEERTSVNRRVKSLKAQLGALPKTPQPVEPVDESALVAELESAGEKKAEIERERSRRSTLVDTLEMRREAAADQTERIEDCRRQIKELEAAVKSAQDERSRIVGSIETIETEIKALPPLQDPPDTSDIRAKIEAARRANAAFSERKRIVDQVAALERELKGVEAESEALSEAIAKRNADKAAAVAAADLPVDGLELGEDSVLFRGLPLDQASDAEQLRVSIAIAAAMNPKLRVIRVRDGSLLDSGGMKLLADFAEKNDLQVWIERVSDGGGSGVIIEDGSVKS